MKTVSEKGHGEAGPGGQDLLRVYRINSGERGRTPGLHQALVGQGKEAAAVPAGRRIGDNQQDGWQTARRRHQTCPKVECEQTAWLALLQPTLVSPRTGNN